MPTAFGEITSIGADGSVRVRLRNGQLLTITETQLRKLGHESLASGAQLRINLQEDGVRDFKVIAGGTTSTSSPSDDRTFQARIVSIDRMTGILHLESADGASTFRPAQLSPEQWSRLVPGLEITLHRDDQGRCTLDIPAREQSTADHGSSPELVLTIPGDGRVTQVSAYHVVVDGSDRKQYGFMRSRFPGRTFVVGDRVAFRAISQKSEIVEIAVLERPTSGFGGINPCQGLVHEIAAQTKRPAITQLAQHFCTEQSLEWYWVTPEEPAETRAVSVSLHQDVLHAVGAAAEGFKGFYTHQARALETLDAGRNVLVLTPTASGKTNCYNPAVFQSLCENPTSHALYVFPLNALLEDQVGKLNIMAESFRDRGVQVTIDLLRGGLDAAYRDRVSKQPPQILSTNPEMLNWVLSRNAEYGWPEFFRRLRFIVLDEVHTYRSLLGLHMAGLVRRLLIACRRYGNPGPQFVLSSATVGAPEALATRLTSLSLDTFDIIDETADGSGHPQRHWMMLSPYPERDDSANINDPHDMHLHQAALALVDTLTVPDESLHTILFAKSIRDVRFLQRLVKQLLNDRGRRDLEPKVAAFASAILDVAERRRIYEELSRGTLRAVISTNALEAGIDIKRLDVCIIAGFPFQVMRFRQMAGRAGRRKAGAVIFIPDPTQVVDKYYAQDPKRLLTHPPETFVIDHENPYVARKHVAACAASMAGGVLQEELAPFGNNLAHILEEGLADQAIERIGATVYTRARRRSSDEKWTIGNLRAAEQVPYVLCKKLDKQGAPCKGASCLEMRPGDNEVSARCPGYVQLLDRQYVYREAHPGAVFEATDGGLYSVVAFDDEQRIVTVDLLPEDIRRRTKAIEETFVEIQRERGRRPVAEGCTLVWGDVRVTRQYAGYQEYNLVPRRRCPQCHVSYDMGVIECPSCRRRTRPRLGKTRRIYQDFPVPYKETTYTVVLNTVACWLILPAELERRMEAVSPCKIPGRENRVAQFLRTIPPFTGPDDLARVVGLPPEQARAAFAYFDKRHTVFEMRKHAKDSVPVYPVFYGQCLRSHLRRELSEEAALGTFAQCTGYPVLKDDRHICRDCVSSMLLPAAHTLEHLVVLGYPTVALGDIQDLGYTTAVIHPQTRCTTIFWYDNYEGGIGAAEKIYSSFDTLLHQGIDNLTCDCRADAGCPMCTQVSQCDRLNNALSKIGVRALLHLLLGLPDYLPEDAAHWTESDAKEAEESAGKQERGQEPIRIPTEEPCPPRDPLIVLRVQPHVHDKVLWRALEIRGEEISIEMPPISVRELQFAYQAIQQAHRPSEWNFPVDWSAYEVLHISDLASKRLMHAAYKSIVRCIHPDVNPDKKVWANEATKRVNAAWEAVQESRERVETEDAEDGH